MNTPSHKSIHFEFEVVIHLHDLSILELVHSTKVNLALSLQIAGLFPLNRIYKLAQKTIA